MEINKLFYGTYGLENGPKTTECVMNAIEAGYRNFDCAYSYGNDFYVGKALKNSGLKREEYFVANKVWKTATTKEEVINMCRKSLKLMKLSYFDLYLVHWPISVNEPDWQKKTLEIWQGMEELQKEGLVKNIGVSNFLEHHLDVLKNAEIRPCLNQIEGHIGCYQKNLIDYCLKEGIMVQMWSPLGSGKLLNNELLLNMANRYGTSVADICLSWLEIHDFPYVCRSANIERMTKNINFKPINISDADMEILDNLNNIGYSGFNPDLNQPSV